MNSADSVDDCNPFMRFLSGITVNYSLCDNRSSPQHYCVLPLWCYPTIKKTIYLKTANDEAWCSMFWSRRPPGTRARQQQFPFLCETVKLLCGFTSVTQFTQWWVQSEFSCQNPLKYIQWVATEVKKKKTFGSFSTPHGCTNTYSLFSGIKLMTFTTLRFCLVLKSRRRLLSGLWPPSYGRLVPHLFSPPGEWWY